MTKHMLITDFLTLDQIKQASDIYERHLGLVGGAMHEEIKRLVVLPNMAQINAKIGQENDPDYITYAIEYVIGASKKQGGN